MSKPPITYRLDRLLSRKLTTKPVKRRGRRPVVTFTFDDFPRSAWTEGGAILQNHGAVGTYYTCGGLTGTSPDGIEQHTENDLIDAAEAGHDIGCHTYSHRRCWPITASELTAELDENKAYLRSVLGDYALASFAYPFGYGGMTAKRVVRDRFPAARGTWSGMSGEGAMNLAELPAHRLYSSTQTEDSVRALVRAAAEQNAWLIFYTHDVTAQPTDWGCTPGLMEAAVQEAHASGCEILSMRNGLGAALYAEADALS